MASSSEPRCTCIMCQCQVPPLAYCPYCQQPTDMSGKCINVRCAYSALSVGFLEPHADKQVRFKAFLFENKVLTSRGPAPSPKEEIRT